MSWDIFFGDELFVWALSHNIISSTFRQNAPSVIDLTSLHETPVSLFWLRRIVCSIGAELFADYPAILVANYDGCGMTVGQVVPVV